MPTIAPTDAMLGAKLRVDRLVTTGRRTRHGVIAADRPNEIQPARR
jgi:hypothetical protein